MQLSIISELTACSKLMRLSCLDRKQQQTSLHMQHASRRCGAAMTKTMVTQYRARPTVKLMRRRYSVCRDSRLTQAFLD